MNRPRFLVFFGSMTALCLSGFGCRSTVQLESEKGETGGVTTTTTGGTGGVTTTTTGGTGGVTTTTSDGVCDLAACPSPSSECVDPVCAPDGSCGEAPKADGTTCAFFGVCSAGSCISDPIEYIKACNTGWDDQFGYSVALSADGNTLAVGAVWESHDSVGINDDPSSPPSVPWSGATYVFTKSGGAWSQQAYIKAANPEVYAWFGYSVALSADGDTLAVGADDEGGGAAGINSDPSASYIEGSGAVYLFARSGGVWSQDALIKAANAELYDHFGSAVALSADGDTLAVGAYREDSHATGVDGDQADNSADDSGAVYVFAKSGGAWSQQAYIKASNADANDYFGAEIALSADGNTLAVSSPQELGGATGVDGDQADNSAPYSGAVYVFTKSGGAWSQQAYIKASNTEAGDWFGHKVALSAEGDTLAVSAPNECSNATGVGGDQTDNSAPYAGAVYVFTKSGGGWSQQAYVKASNNEEGDFFGESVALSADGSTLAIGARGEDSGATGVNGDPTDNSAAISGAVYVLIRYGDVWSQMAYIKASNTEVDDNFGTAVALSADGTTLAVVAAKEDSGATGVNGDQADNTAQDSGAVYLY